MSYLGVNAASASAMASILEANGKWVKTGVISKKILQLDYCGGFEHVSRFGGHLGSDNLKIEI